MDPAGIRELLLLRPYVANPYQFEPIVRTLPYKTRTYVHYSTIPWLPVFPPLTQRVSTASEGYPGYLQHDLAIVAGTDLESCTERDLQHLRAAGERGLPLWVCGGSFGLSSSYRLWHDLDELLPAHVPPGDPIAVTAEVRAATDHPLLEGLPATFGDINSIHVVEPADDAVVLLEAAGRPVLLATERYGSRQLMLTVHNAGGLSCDGVETTGFYGHSFYSDLVRQALTWLMGVAVPLRFTSLELPTGTQRSEPGAHRLRVGVAQASLVPGAGLMPGARLRSTLRSVDEGRLMAGGDTVATTTLHEEIRPLQSLSALEEFELEDPLPRRSSGLYEVELALEMDDPPSQPPRACFGMAVAPGWNNWRGAAVATRRFRLRFADQRRAQCVVPGWNLTLQTGRELSLQVTGATAAPVLTVMDSDGTEVGHATGVADPQEQRLAWVPPPLTLGTYTAQVTIPATGPQTPDESFRFALESVAVPDAEASFHMVAHFPWLQTNDDELGARLDECLDSFGLDTISIGGMREAAAHLDRTRGSLERPLELRKTRWLDAQVAARGRHLWTDFDAPLVVLATHGATREYDPTVPCVHHPDYEATVRERLTPRLLLQAARPGLISTEIVDEPHLYPSNVCYCDICRGLYEERYGEAMPQWRELEGDHSLRRWHFFQWLEEYSTRAFAIARQVQQEVAPGVRRHNVPIDRLFTSDFMFNSMHRWAGCGDELHMACYPFAYRVWRGHKQMPHSQTHWIAAWVRALASHYDLPWGVFMELWEHDTPNRWMPPYWSVGQFYALLAAGVTRLDTFILSFTFEGFGISDERLREFGAAINQVRPHFPLLAGTRRPRARLAFINPWCQWVMDPPPHRLPPDHEGYGYYRLSYGTPFDEQYPHDNRRMMAYQLFQRAFNDLDQVDEQLLCEREMDYRAIVVSDCRFLMRRTADQLKSFVADGGVLVLDCRPELDEAGNALDFYAPLTAGPPTAEGAIVPEGAVVPGLTYCVHRHGAGHVIVFSASLQTTYSDAVESERAGLIERYEQTVAALLQQCGVVPRWKASCADLDVGVRHAPGTCLVPVANLSPQARTGRITVRDVPFEPALAIDLTSGALLTPSGDGGQVEFDVTLEGYHGALVALLPARPHRCRVVLAQAAVPRGDRLEYDLWLEDTDGQAVNGRFQVDVTITDGEGRIHRGLGGPLIVLNGHVHHTVDLPVNAPPGLWQLSATDPVLGLTAAAAFECTAG